MVFFKLRLEELPKREFFFFQSPLRVALFLCTQSNEARNFLLLRRSKKTSSNLFCDFFIFSFFFSKSLFFLLHISRQSFFRYRFRSASSVSFYFPVMLSSTFLAVAAIFSAVNGVPFSRCE